MVTAASIVEQEATAYVKAEWRFPLPPTEAATASADVDALAEAADVETEAALSAAVVKVEATAASDGCHSLHGT